MYFAWSASGLGLDWFRQMHFRSVYIFRDNPECLFERVCRGFARFSAKALRGDFDAAIRCHINQYFFHCIFSLRIFGIDRDLAHQREQRSWTWPLASRTRCMREPRGIFLAATCKEYSWRKRFAVVPPIASIKP